jgi:uncharacterized iron-regulated membrane protein
MTAAEPAERSSVVFDCSARGVIQPRVKVVAGDTDAAALDDMLAQAERLYRQAAAFARTEGVQP